MFTEADRDRTLQALIARAEADPDVRGAVLLGSSATGTADRWSDLDLALTLRGPARPAADRWTDELATEFGVLHYWDFAVGADSVIRVFLLGNEVEVDLGFYPEGSLVQRGPWRPVFGDFTDSPPPPPAPDTRLTIGMAWHHILHTRVCIERGRLWQAEHWIGQTRGHVLALACHRFGHPADYAKGAHLLPPEATEALGATLVRSLDVPELRRALTATAEAFDRELRHHDPALADRLKPVLAGS